jgi:ankyrin repeat protein
MEIIKLLLEYNADPDIQNSWGQTTLHWAAGSLGNNEIVEILLRNKANPNMQNSLGDTPLHIAARDGQKESVETLLKYKANKNIIGSAGKAAAVALSNGHKDIVALINSYHKGLRIIK